MTFFAILIIARLTNALQFYRCTTNAMSPTIELNNLFFSTNLIKPKHNDIIIFKRKTDMYDGVQDTTKMFVFTYRLIAMGGEKLEIKDGLAYVNDKLVDDTIKLKFYYQFSSKKGTEILSALQLDQTKLNGEEGEFISSDTIIIASLTYPQYITVKKITPLAKRTGDSSADLFAKGTRKWTSHDYGPITIPTGHYFLMGDNRDGARDSRFIGPVDEKKVTGVVIGK